MEQLVQFAQKAYIVNDDKLLIIKSRDYNVWEVPGGRKNLGEGLEEHVKREVFEEIGVDIKPLQPFGISSFVHDKNGIEIVVVARLCRLDGEQTFKIEDSITEYRWVDINQSMLSDYKFPENMMPVLMDLIKNYHLYKDIYLK